MLTAPICAYLLRGADSRGRYRLLLWSGVGFVGLTLNNLVLLLDKSLHPGRLDDLAHRHRARLAEDHPDGLIWDAE